MNNFEDLFKKVKKDIIRLDTHKEKLKHLLLKDDYFNKSKESWDYKLSFASIAFSAFLIVFAINFSGGSAASQGSISASDNETFYTKLERNKNVVPGVSGSGDNVLEMNVEDNVKTVFYFDQRNVLIHSEVLNNK